MDELHDIQGLVKVATYEDLKKMAMEITGDDIVEQVRTIATSTTETSEKTSEEGDDYLSHLKGLE